MSIFMRLISPMLRSFMMVSTRRTSHLTLPAFEIEHGIAVPPLLRRQTKLGYAIVGGET